MAGDWTQVGEFTEKNGKHVQVEHNDRGEVRFVIRAPIKGGPVLSQIVLADEAMQEEFARHLVNVIFAAKAAAEQRRRASGMNPVERAARDLIGIPDTL